MPPLGDRIKTWLLRGLVKGLSVGFVPDWVKASFMVPTFQALARAGYAANAAVFACCAVWGRSYPEPPLTVYGRAKKTGQLTPLPDHPLQRILQPVDYDLPGMSIIYRLIGGDNYWYKVRNRARQPIGLTCLSDAYLTPCPGGEQLVGYYEWQRGAGQPPAQIDPADVVHFRWLVDPEQPWRGQAPLKAAARQVDADNEVDRYIFALLKNDAMPRVILGLPAGTTWNDDKDKRAKAMWRERYGGDNRGMPAILEGGWTVNRIGFDMQELAFEALHRVPEARIAAVTSVPAVLAGLNVGLEQATYSNMEGMQKWFTRQVLVPTWRADGRTITNSLAREFGDDIVVAFDLSQVQALAEDLQATRTFSLESFRSGLFMKNESRALLGMPRDRNGDVYATPMTVTLEPGQLETPAGPGKALPPGAVEDKAARTAARRRAQFQVGQQVRAQRLKVARKMAAALDDYFAALADRVVERLGGKSAGAVLADPALIASEVKRLELTRLGVAGDLAARDVLARELSWASIPGERKDLPAAEELLTEEDTVELEALIQKHYLAVCAASWDIWNAELNLPAAFDPGDPAVAEALATAGDRVRKIDEATLQYLRDTLQYGASQGWSVDHLVRGDPDAGIPGIRSLVEETYKKRAQNIARTEIGNAQNLTAYGRYEAAGVGHVFVMDNGQDDDDEPCKEVNGTVQTVQWMKDNPLQHPSCTRCFAAESPE